ncbi:MAG: glutamine synthetase adenylyltransferase [Anaerolineae bacterium]
MQADGDVGHPVGGLLAMYPSIYQESRELLSEDVTAEDIQRWLIPVGFADWEAGYRRLRRIAKRSGAAPTLARLLPYLLMMLSEVALPDRALVNLERFLQSGAAMADQLDYLARNLRSTEILIKLFSGSQFLTEILLRNPEYFDILVRHQRLAQAKTVEAFCAELPDAEQGTCASDRLDGLRRFQRWELLRIGTCDLLGLFDLPRVTEQLSNLADSVIRACLDIAAGQVIGDTVAGDPIAGSEDASWGHDASTIVEGFAVLAMGKLGGRELNYSSDIDLLFLADHVASHHQQLGERLIEALTKMTSEGFLYRVDMRLRPWGRSGPLVTSVGGYLSYLQEHARLWERQALLKTRAVAGDLELGRAFLTRAAPIVFDVRPDEVRESVQAMKQMTEDRLREQGREWGEVKLGEGSIRDVEFVTQSLQLIHGGRYPSVRSENTLNGLSRLSTAGLISAHDTRILTSGYVFLRTIEHYLQMMHYQQMHRLPQSPDELTRLARRLGFEGPEAGQQFVQRYEQHRAAIRGVYLRHLRGGPVNATNAASRQTDLGRAHIARMDASYATVFTATEIERHAQMAARLGHDHLVEVEAVPLAEDRWRVTVVGVDYPGELSLICGLLFFYGCSIEEGHVFTYEPGHRRGSSEALVNERRKIVDAFTVQAVREPATAETWQAYAEDLSERLQLMQAGRGREARGELAKRVASIIPSVRTMEATLYPVDIQIDNESASDYTVLHITAPDTIGFLYELTNALAYSHIYISRVRVESFGDRAHDTLFVTDANGRKIVSPEKEHELRAAIVLIKHFTHLLPQTPDPETALLHFREFISHLFRQPDWPDELASLENPEVLNGLAHLLGVSEFLWDDFLRMQHANLFPVVRDVDALETKKTRAQLQAELEKALAVVHDGPQAPAESPSWRETINAFKDREMFRIDMRHILGHTEEFWDFSDELTSLAEVVVNATYHLCHEDLRAQYGTPHLADGGISEMCVCALGKCGGCELGFASDIELMFIYSGNGETSGPDIISTAEFYERLVQMFIQVIDAKREGVFEIDVQLRPYGSSGSMAVSLESFRRYFAPAGPAWAYERQALVKLRPIAGNAGLGQEVATLRDRFVYDSAPFDVTAMRAMRERQIRHLVTGGTFNAKYSPGGLVDVEYLVQALQMTYGDRYPSLRSTNIREAMRALAEEGLLSPGDYTQLRKAHTFLRWLIDGLRMVRGNAKDLTVPDVDSEAFAFLARRLRYGNDVQRLREDLTLHTTAVLDLNRRLLG